MRSNTYLATPLPIKLQQILSMVLYLIAMVDSRGKLVCIY